jgi:hypothetical protein
MLSAQGRLLSYKKVATIPAARLDSLLQATKTPPSLVQVRYTVDVYLVLYTTAFHDGSEVEASGYYLVPQNPQENLARLSYNHGSRLKKRSDSISAGFKFSGEEAICAFFATDGYAVTMPDFIGLGLGEGMHLYHHSETEALANVNLLRATAQINRELGLPMGDQLFISGYSQGGHAALSTHRYMQQHLPDEFRVTACAPMSGAYDLDGVQSQVMYKPYDTPSYLPYLLYSMQEAYHVIPDSESFFIAPYDTLLPPLYDGSLGLRDVNAYLPATPAAIVRPELMTMMEKQPDNPLAKALQANSPIDWAPEAPVMLCYCTGDEQVKYENAAAAKKGMKAEGAKHIKTRKAGGRKFRHGPCAIYTNIYAKYWFDSFRKGSKYGRKGPWGKRVLLRLGRMGYKKKSKK